MRHASLQGRTFVRFGMLIVILWLASCAYLEQAEPPNSEEARAVTVPGLAAPPPPPAARTAEQFDTTTEEQRAAASEPSNGGTLLGTTIASLGDPSRPGFWAETDLVDSVTLGRLEYPATGKSVEVELTPAGEGGSRVSLAAMRVLEAPLTALPELDVYSN